MCSNLRQKSKIITPGSLVVTSSYTGRKIFGYPGAYYNARIEKFEDYKKNFNFSYITCDGFYEGKGFFGLPPLDEINLACFENETIFLIITQPSTGCIIEKFHARMPVILRDEISFIKKGTIDEYPHSFLKLVA